MASDIAHFDRRKWSKRDIVPIVILSVNLAGFIWGAAKMSAAIEGLKEAQQLSNVEHRDYDLRLRIIENEVAVLRTRVSLNESSIRRQ